MDSETKNSIPEFVGIQQIEVQNDKIHTYSENGETPSEIG